MARRLHRTYRFFNPRRNSVACLHPNLRALLVEGVQPISERHRNNSLASYRGSANRLDVGDLGN